MTRKIPYLDCLWNDVLHLTSVCPFQLSEALAVAGFALDARFFVFDPKIIEAENTVVYLNTGGGDRQNFAQRDFVPFAENELTKYATIPNATIAYYHEMKKTKRMPLLFHGIPHILFRGTISIKDVQEVDVSAVS